MTLNGKIPEVATAFQSMIKSLDQANRQLIYNLMWGKGGWKEFGKALKNIFHQLLADITYAIIKTLALKALMGVVGLAFTPTAISSLSSMPVAGGSAMSSAAVMRFGSIPAYPTGAIPSNHMLAFIDPREAIINQASTRANVGLLNAINQSNGKAIALDNVVQSNISLNVDGKVLAEVVDKHRQVTANYAGTTSYPRRSAYR
jgi:hypothetical protein